MDNEQRRPGASSSTYCVAVGCNNNRGRDGERGVKFHRFPSQGTDRYEVWVKSLNRKSRDGSLWRPGVGARICSEHFAGGMKSNDPQSPSYNPTIFSTLHVKPRTLSDIQRYDRHVIRSTAKAASHSEIVEQLEVIEDMSKTRSVDACVQTDEYCPDPTHSFVFELDVHSSKEKGTMANVPVIHTSSVDCQTDMCGETNSSVSLLSYDDGQFKAMTGVTKNFFNFLSYKVGDKLKDTKKLSRNSRLLLFLFKLKLHLSFMVLSALFSCSERTARRTFFEAVDIVHEIAEGFIIWFRRETINARMPSAFRAQFPKTRVIIDATEIECERPGSQRARILMWSQYKGRWTVKFLVGIAPSGEFTFVSRGFGGRTTDTEITNQCGLLKLLEEDDVVLADKGFPYIENKIRETGAILVMPPFKQADRQFTTQQNRDCYQIARVRVHVERAIRRLKYFEILNFVPSLMLPHIDKIFVIVSFFANFFNDLIDEDDA